MVIRHISEVILSKIQDIGFHLRGNGHSACRKRSLFPMQVKPLHVMPKIKEADHDIAQLLLDKMFRYRGEEYLQVTYAATTELWNHFNTNAVAGCYLA